MQVIQVPVDDTRRETTLHGQPDFPLAVYQSARSLNDFGEIPWHWHEELQFCLVTRGTVEFLVGETRYLVRAGEGIYIDQGYIHSARIVGDPASHYLCLNFDRILLYGFPGSVLYRKYIEPFQADSALAAIPLVPDADWQSLILQGIYFIDEQMKGSAFGREYEILQCLFAMWQALVLHRPVPELADRPSRLANNETVQRIISYVEDHYRERITLDAIGHAIAFCPEECCRLFKRVTGDTIFAYLLQYRLARAVEQLNEPNAVIGQIALDCGFCSASHFIEAFRTRYRMTPRQYMRSRHP